MFCAIGTCCVKDEEVGVFMEALCENTGSVEYGRALRGCTVANKEALEGGRRHERYSLADRQPQQTWRGGDRSIQHNLKCLRTFEGNLVHLVSALVGGAC
jgi:hypothetical protein